MGLCEIEQQSIFPEYLIFATNDYVFRPEGIFGTLVSKPAITARLLFFLSRLQQPLAVQ